MSSPFITLKRVTMYIHYDILVQVDQVSEGSDQVVSVAHPLTVEPELEQKEAENVIVVIPI
jgi:hypothetical protein